MSAWPFKRKSKVSSSISDENTVFIKPKTRKASKAAIAGGFICAFISLAAGATGIGISAWKYSGGSEFSKSYNIRFQVEQKSETPFNSRTEHPIEGDFQDNLNKTADAYSKFLNSKGINNVNVYPEYDKVKGEGFINANIPNERYYDNVEEKYVDMDPTTLYEESINSSRLSLILNIDNDGVFATSVIPLNDGGTNGASLIDLSNTKINGTNKNEIDIKLRESLSDVVDKCLKNTTTSGEQKSVGADTTTNNTQVYLVRDFNGMVNYMNFVLQAYFEEDKGKNNTNITNNFAQEESKFYDDFKATVSRGGGDSFKLDTTANYYDYANGDKISITDDTPKSKTNGSNAQYWFTKNNGSPSTDGTNKALQYKFLSQYVIGLGAYDTEASTETTSYTNVIPHINPSTGKSDGKYQYVVAKMPNRSDANELLDGIQNTTFTLPSVAINNADLYFNNSALTEDKGTIANMRNQTVEQGQTLQPTIFGFSPLIGILISLCFIILAIGILVSVLYRGPGAFGCFAMVASFGVTLMILILSNYALSVAMFIGLFVGILGSVLSIFGFSERVKKIQKTGIAFESALRKGLKSGFLPMLDIHAIMLLIGVGVAYFGGVQIAVFGTTLLLYSIISFVFVGVIWLGATILLLNNKIGVNKPNWFLWKQKKQKNMVKLLDDKVYETTYCGQFEPKRFSVFGWKQILCSSLVLAIGIVGIILILVLGVHSSYLFYGGTRIVLPVELFDAHVGSFGSWSEKVVSNNIVYLYYDHPFPLDSAGWWTPGFNDGDNWVSVQSINSAGAVDFATKTIYVLLISSGLISAYTFVRLNWVSVIPAFLGTLVTPLLAVGVIAVCQIYFDLYIIMAIVVLYTINAILVINFVGILNNQWLRKQMYYKQDLKKIINAEIKNALFFYLRFYIVIIVSLGIFMLFNSTDLIWFFLIIIIGVLCSIAILYSIVPIFLYLFIRIRYKYLSRVSSVENPLLRKNYDEIDEQLLEGINKFKRKRPTL